MGKKDLKLQHKDLQIDIIDLLSELDPSKTNKFLILLIKKFKEEITSFKSHIKEELKYVIGSENLKALKDFNTHLENNRTKIKDISLLNDFADLHEQLVFAEIKLKKNDLKKEIKIIYKDDEWLILKPLSYESSKIYGAGTKWCTSSRNENTPFYRYSNDGILLYVIKLGTNEKFGVHWYLEKEKGVEMSWWDSEDRKVDSMTLKLPSKITQIVLDHFLEHKKPNSYYFKGIDKENCERIVNNDGGEYPTPYTATIEDTVIDDSIIGDNIYRSNRIYEQPIWTIYNGDNNTTTTYDVDSLVNKTLEYTYSLQAMKKSLEDLNIPE